MSRILITKGVKEYRRTIPCFVKKQDSVLEIGCAWGTTSALLYRFAGTLIAIDKGASLPKAKELYPHIHFVQMDGFDISRILGLETKFTVVYIDISG
jgi:protein-L-isoaspartate O-methyltransferase